MGFTEKTHAYLSAKYYRYLTGLFGDRGLQAFIHATRHYAMQRGQRMAQRAIRDGRALTQETYNQYGEWLPTDEITSLGQQNKKRCENDAMYMQQCPWKAMFDEMNAGECRDVYCSRQRHLARLQPRSGLPCRCGASRRQHLHTPARQRRHQRRQRRPQKNGVRQEL